MLKQKRNAWILILVLGIVVLYLIPFAASTNITFRLASVFVMALFAMSFNLLLGYTGLVSFGQAAYFAIGAYSYALFVKAFPNFVVGILFAMVCAALCSLILGFISLRATGIYFAILTLALGQLVYLLLYKSDWTGGQNGLSGIKAPPLSVGGWELTLHGMPNYYFVAVTTVLISLLVFWTVVRSRFGQNLLAIREDATRAQFLGINVKRVQLVAFVVSSAFTGLAGALYAPLNSVITADIAAWGYSATPLIISLLGGYHYFLGPALGAVIYEAFHYVTSSFADAAELFTGILLLLVILLVPRGVLGLYELLLEKGPKRHGSAWAQPGKKGRSV